MSEFFRITKNVGHWWKAVGCLTVAIDGGSLFLHRTAYNGLLYRILTSARDGHARGFCATGGGLWWCIAERDR